eukprot:879961-Pelagomonas_calceolata.AAC.3
MVHNRPEAADKCGGGENEEGRPALRGRLLQEQGPGLARWNAQVLHKPGIAWSLCTGGLTNVPHQI